MKWISTVEKPFAADQPHGAEVYVSFQSCINTNNTNNTNFNLTKVKLNDIILRRSHVSNDECLDQPNSKPFCRDV